MFNGSHLALIIANSIVPLIWIWILITHFRRYISLREEYLDLKNSTDRVVAGLENKTGVDERSEELRKELLDQHIHMSKSCEWDLKYAKFNLIFWVCMAFIFIVTSIVNISEMCIKLYHHNCPCELRDAKKVEVRVENAKEGPQFSVTTNNLRVE